MEQMIDHEEIQKRLEEHDRVWNAAIESAIKVAVAERHNMEMEQKIRKLKK